MREVNLNSSETTHPYIPRKYVYREMLHSNPKSNKSRLGIHTNIVYTTLTYTDNYHV